MVRAAGSAPAYSCSRRKRLTFRLRSVDGHEGSAPSIPVWKTGVYLSTLMPVEMESRAGIALASAVL